MQQQKYPNKTARKEEQKKDFDQALFRQNDGDIKPKKPRKDEQKNEQVDQAPSKENKEDNKPRRTRENQKNQQVDQKQFRQNNGDNKPRRTNDYYEEKIQEPRRTNDYYEEKIQVDQAQFRQNEYKPRTRNQQNKQEVDQKQFRQKNGDNKPRRTNDYYEEKIQEPRRTKEYYEEKIQEPSRTKEYYKEKIQVDQQLFGQNGEQFKPQRKEEQEKENILRLIINGSTLYGKEGSLDIYLYPEYKFEDLSQSEKQNLRVIMVVGQTGSGKSTMLDAMVNFLAGINFDYPFRYKLINEKSILAQKNNDQSQSITDDVKEYIIKPGPNVNYPPILVIDTPGFMDTRGIQRDQLITKNIEEYFSMKSGQITRIHCLCLVSVSSNVRLTCSQRYVFNQVLQLFAKDIKSNVVNFFTFSDGGKPQVLQAIQNEGIPSQYWYQFNNSTLFVKTSQNSNPFEKMYWQLSASSMEKFFGDVGNQLIAQSLVSTRTVLSSRKILEQTAMNLQRKMDLSLVKLEEARQAYKSIEQYENDASLNKQYSVTVEVEKFRKIQLLPGINTTTCRECQRTCHENCSRKDDLEKTSCSIMKEGYCTICPKKCHWTSHSNVPYVFQSYKIKEQRESSSGREKYLAAVEKRVTANQRVSNLSQDLQRIEKEINIDIKTIQTSFSNLNNIALRPNPYSQMDILSQMIQNETNRKEQGFLQRISMLEEVKMQYELLHKLTIYSDSSKILQEHFKEYHSTLIEIKKKQNINLYSIK